MLADRELFYAPKQLDSILYLVFSERRNLVVLVVIYLTVISPITFLTLNYVGIIANLIWCLATYNLILRSALWRAKLIKNGIRYQILNGKILAKNKDNQLISATSYKGKKIVVREYQNSIGDIEIGGGLSDFLGKAIPDEPTDYGLDPVIFILYRIEKPRELANYLNLLSTA